VVLVNSVFCWFAEFLGVGDLLDNLRLFLFHEIDEGLDLLGLFGDDVCAQDEAEVPSVFYHDSRRLIIWPEVELSSSSSRRSAMSRSSSSSGKPTIEACFAELEDCSVVVHDLYYVKKSSTMMVCTSTGWIWKSHTLGNLVFLETRSLVTRIVVVVSVVLRNP
jgi:hypothetical protein